MPERLIQHYIDHRLARHARVFEAVEGGLTAVEAIAKHAYADSPEAHPGLAVDQTRSHLLAHETSGTLVHQHGEWFVKEVV